MRVGYLGPEGTFSHQALLDADAARGGDAVALATLYDTVMAVQDGDADAALVPIENSLEGSVDVTLDTLATDATDVAIVGETVATIRNCLIAAAPLELAAIETVYSHPQSNAQCATSCAAACAAPACPGVLHRRGGPERDRGPDTPVRGARQPLAAALYGGRSCSTVSMTTTATRRALSGSRRARRRPSARWSAAMVPARPRSSSGAPGTRRPAGWSIASPSSRSATSA